MNGMLVRWMVVVFALVLATTAGAATRYWYLQDVAFDDGTTVSGSFSYDDVTHDVGSWAVRVKAGAHYLPFTYLPGNSAAYTSVGYVLGGSTTVIIASDDGGSGAAQAREFRITPTAALDGSPQRPGRCRDGPRAEGRPERSWSPTGESFPARSICRCCRRR
ncbi:MAG: hypothetical protein IPI87_18365 [Betaproteobacteria bacterium]|nr:hypothetical protein [Betaproteobacteria bacterium]